MGLRFNREDASHGALIVGKVQSLESAFKTTAYNTVPPIPGMDWGLLEASTDGYVLTCSAAAAEGVAWAAPAVPTAPDHVHGNRRGVFRRHCSLGRNAAQRSPLPPARSPVTRPALAPR